MLEETQRSDHEGFGVVFGLYRVAPGFLNHLWQEAVVGFYSPICHRPKEGWGLWFITWVRKHPVFTLFSDTSPLITCSGIMAMSNVYSLQMLALRFCTYLIMNRLAAPASGAHFEWHSWGWETTRNDVSREMLQSNVCPGNVTLAARWRKTYWVRRWGRKRVQRRDGKDLNWGRAYPNGEQIMHLRTISETKMPGLDVGNMRGGRGKFRDFWKN